MSESAKIGLNREFVKVQLVNSRYQCVVTYGCVNLPMLDDVAYVDLGHHDVSILFKSLAVVISDDSYTSKIDNIVCFAKEYGIPVIWLGGMRPPESKLFNFSLVTDDPNLVWRYLCQIK